MVKEMTVKTRITYSVKVAALSAAILNGNVVSAAPPVLLFQESFDDTNFASRGWYDNTGVAISTAEHIAGSTASAQYTFNQGEQTAPSGGAIRKSFTETEEVYVSYYVKYSTNWQGSNLPYHPHEFYLLTNQNDAYSGLSVTRLTAYIEQNEGEPILAIQDAQNIDPNNVNVNLVNTSENRAVSGCNGVGGAAVNHDDCYGSAPNYRNEAVWRAGEVYFSDQTGSRYKNDWHHVEAYFRMNTITNGRGNYDGIAQYWYDGQLIINHTNVLLRTGQFPNLQFDMIAIGPYIGAGSPVTQTMWIDNLTVATSKLDAVRPNPPTNLTVQ